MSVPPPVPALPDAQRLTSYSISGSTGPFAVNFALYGDGTDYGNWIEVWLNGVQLAAAAGYTLSSPSGTLGSIALPITDAVITLVAAGTGDLEIRGARRPRRVAQFAESQGVAARDLNQAITDQIAQTRELWDFTRKSTITFPVQSGLALPQLLPAAARANQFLSFDAAGNLTTSAVGPPPPGPATGAGLGGISVKDFGAQGNGINNDTSAIQNALNSGNYLIYFPAGNYLISSTITVPNGVSLIGVGSGSWASEAFNPVQTKITWSGPNNPVYMFDFDPTHQRWTGNVKGIRFTGSFNSNLSMLNFHAMISCIIENVMLEIYGGQGFDIGQGTYGFPAGQTVFNQCSALPGSAHSGTCLRAAGSGISGINFNKCNFQGGNNATCVEIAAASDTNAFFGCDITCGGTSGIAVNIHDAGFNNNFFAGNIETDNAAGSIMLKATNNNNWSHLYGTYLAFGPTVYNDGGNGKVMFHHCLTPTFDNTGDFTYASIANGGNYTLPLNTGLVTIQDRANGKSATYLCGGGNGVNMISSIGGEWVAPTTTPAGGTASIAYSSGNKIYNNTGATMNAQYNVIQISGS